MLRRICALLASAILVSVLGCITALPAFADLDTTDPGREDPGTPTDANCWGETTQQFTPLGEHSSSFGEPRQGVGNVAMQPPEEGGDTATEETVSSHGALQGQMAGLEPCVDNPQGAA